MFQNKHVIYRIALLYCQISPGHSTASFNMRLPLANRAGPRPFEQGLAIEPITQTSIFLLATLQLVRHVSCDGSRLLGYIAAT